MHLPEQRRGNAVVLLEGLGEGKRVGKPAEKRNLIQTFAGIE